MSRLPDGIIFDLDGTLLDTLDDIGDTANAVLAKRKCALHDRGTYRRFIGDGVSKLMERALPEGDRSPESVAIAAEEFAREYDLRWHNKSQPYGGIGELLRDVLARRIKLAVLSNKPQRFTEVCVRRWFGDVPFDPVFGQREGVARKPDPAGVFEILKSWRLSPEQVWYVGDSSVDMETATRAGVTAIGVTWGFRDREELVRLGATRVIDRPSELLGPMSKRNQSLDDLADSR